jgi:hypothetical protein
MLDPWIIEEIRRREDERRDREAGRVELPLESPHSHDSDRPAPAPPRDEKGDRGVVIIDL